MPEGGRRRGGGRSRWGTVALAATGTLLGLLIVMAGQGVRAERPAEAGRRAQLAEMILLRQRHTTSLEQDLAGLRLEMESRQSEALSGQWPGQAIRASVLQLESLAGLTEMEGPGVVVALSDAEGYETSSVDRSSVTVQDLDIQEVVNALWDCGAEAVEINGERLTGLSAIRAAGGTVLVNFQIVSSPYRIVALGDGHRMKSRFLASSIARRFRKWVDAYGLGIEVEQSASLRVAAYRGGVRFRYAHVEGES